MSTPKQADASEAQKSSNTGIAEPPSTRSRLRAALAQPRTGHHRPIGELLTQAGSIHDTGVRRGLILQGNEPDMRLGELLLKAGEIHADELYRALGEQLGVTYVRLAEFDVEPAALAALPAEVVHAHRVLPLMFNEHRLVVASADPTDHEILSKLRLRSQHDIEMVLANPSELDQSIGAHYAAAAGEKPAIRLVNSLLLHAVHRRASAIHLRSLDRRAEIRYRIDGSLVSTGEFDGALLPPVVARIKALANMDVAEDGLPQDGSFRFNTPGGEVDMRISIIPTVRGPNVVIRVLDPTAGLRQLTDIGLLERDQRRFAGLLAANQGLVLVTGSIGSGTTTTLYAALQKLNTGERNIVTVEDPVEYLLDGIVQIQVQPAGNFGFAQALTPILRHDPDVILIGEIRDSETARLAADSALSGQLVLSTLRTNSAAQAITRLVEMGIPRYLVNGALAGVLAQRLVHRNCEHCKVAEEVDDGVRASLGVGDSETFWRGHGCKECGGTGCRGRVAVYELLEMTPQLRELVTAGASHEHLEARAVEQGMVRLPLQALALARSGVISLGAAITAPVIRGPSAHPAIARSQSSSDCLPRG
jgi:type IV pilus assembly protein PilB